MIKKLLFVQILLLFTIFLEKNLNGQVGALDTTFNHNDKGFGIGEGGNNLVYTTLLQNDGKIIIGGQFTSFQGNKINYFTRLNSNGTVDTSFKNGNSCSGIVHSLAIQSDQKILVGGVFQSYDNHYINRMVRLNSDGTIDYSFNIGSGFNDDVGAICIQNDGKIIVGGSFTSYNGTNINRLVRLNIDGSIDNTFNVGNGADSWIGEITIQSDNKILIGGGFTSYNNISRNRIARLNSDGSLDTSFDPGTGFNISVNTIGINSLGKIIVSGFFNTYKGSSKRGIVKLNSDGSVDNSFNGGLGAFYINSMVVLPDDKIVIVGDFNTYNGINTISGVTRLNDNGSIDNTFNIDTILSNQILSISPLSNGKYIIGGSFSSFNSQKKYTIACLNNDGSLENSFNKFNGTGANSSIYKIVIQPDEKILLAGNFAVYNGSDKRFVVRVNADGSIDNSFSLGTGLNNTVYSMAKQPDGKIILAGDFTLYNGITTNRIVRLNNDGSIDNSFNCGTGANGIIYAVDVQVDNKILITGEFTTFNNVSANKILRINQDGSIDNSFITGSGLNNAGRVIKIQNDGKILVGGLFWNYNGASANRILRLKTDGTVDQTFNVGLGFDGPVYDISIQVDGKILACGNFGKYNGTNQKNIARINRTGNIDLSFNGAGSSYKPILSMCLQSDNKILIGGDFISYNNSTANNFLRLNNNGSIDNTFKIENSANNSVNTICIQKNGNILMGGDFTSYNGIGRNRIARLIGDSPIDSCNQLQIHFKDINDISCQNTIGSAVATAYYGTSPYLYSWVNSYNSIDSLATFNSASIYNCIVHDGQGCVDSASILISGTKFPTNYDLSTNLITGNFRTGFPVTLNISSSNEGCKIESGTLKAILSSNTIYNSAIPSPDKISGDTLIWNFSNLQYLSTPFTPQLNVTTSNAAQIGDTIHLRTIITPITGDADTNNNIKDYYYPVINGYDPNDISVNPRGNCAKNYISNNQTLTYTVRFQNTGNAEAINIAVLDSLSSNLDLNTLRVLASSDTMYTMILPNNVVKFMFDSIMLADSNHNEAASHGYVVFEIKPKANLSNETTIENKVGIYFDFNPAVVTNTVFNTITDGSAYPCILTNVENIETKNNTLYPNPSSGIFTLTSSILAQNITVYDQTGRRIMNIIPTQNTTSIDLGNVSNGMYFIQVKSHESVQVLKAVVQK